MRKRFFLTTLLIAMLLLACAPETTPGDATVNELAELVQQNPNNPQHRFDFGMAFLNSEAPDYALAAEQFLRAAQLDPTWAAAHYNAGVCLTEDSKYPEATESFQTALALDPGDAKAWNNLGVVYNLYNRFAEARDAFAQATVLDPSYYEAFFNLGFAYEKLRMMPEAIESYETAIPLRPEVDLAYTNVARLYHFAGLYETAIERLMVADGLTPNNPEVLYDLYKNHAALGHLSEAEQYYEAAVSIDPRYAEIHITQEQTISADQLEAGN